MAGVLFVVLFWVWIGALAWQLPSILAVKPMQWKTESKRVTTALINKAKLLRHL